MRKYNRTKILFGLFAIGLVLMACNLGIPVTGLDSTSNTQTAIAREIYTNLTLTAASPKATGSPSPSPTSTVTLTSTPVFTSTVAGPPCNAALFVADVTVPDDTTFSPGTAFIKTWRFKNIGSCVWNSSYQVVFASGDPMGAPAAFNLKGSIPPGATGDLSVSLTAPASAGTYQDYFKFRAGDGSVFGVGPAYIDPFYTRIKVALAPAPPSATPVPSSTPKIILSLVVPLFPKITINPALLWTPTPVFIIPKFPLPLLPSP
jgi:hypothetical protein